MSEIAVHPSKPILLESFPDLIELIPTTKPEESIYLSMGLGLLRNVVRFKAYPNLLNPLSYSLEQSTAGIKSLAAQLSLAQDLELFGKTYDILSGNKNRVQCMEWLEKYVSGTFPDVTRAIVRTVQILACSLLLEKGLQVDGVFSGSLGTEENNVVMQGLAVKFSTYFRLVWDTGSYIYEIPNKTSGFIINLYYSNSFYSLLCSRKEKEVDENLNNMNLPGHDAFLYMPLNQENQKIDEEVKIEAAAVNEIYNQNTDKSFVSPGSPERLSNPVDVQNIFYNPIQGNEVCSPLLANLLSVMAKKIIENKFFSKEIQDAFNNAFEQFPTITYIPGMEEMSKISDAFCEIHRDNNCEVMFCNNKHCKFCIYDIIINKLTKENYKIFCPCSVQIPPKDIDRMRKEESYKEYRKSK